MNKDVLSNSLFDVNTLYFKSLFDGIGYAWEVLPLLKQYILDCPKYGFVEILPCVYVSDNVTIHPSAVIEAPSIIGANTEIRPGAYIRGSVIIGEGCVIGNSTEIKNSVLMNGVQVPHYNYVGDSILGNFAHMGAGSICSNLKSDGSCVTVRGEEDISTGLRKFGAVLADRAEIGCNCVLNPGTVIGRNTTVYPLTSVRGVIPSDSIVKSPHNIVKKAIL